MQEELCLYGGCLVQFIGAYWFGKMDDDGLGWVGLSWGMLSCVSR